MEHLPENDKPYKELLHSEEEVDARIGEMAAEILENYDSSPLFVCLMRGGAPFSAQLMREITRQDPNFHPEMDYMTISTYGSDRESKRPRVVMDIDPRTEIEGREAILLDDVFDEGNTVKFARDHLRGLGAAAVKVAVLGDKGKEMPEDIPRPEMVGFNLPDEWLTGMGMDDAGLKHEANRWMGGIGISK